MHTFTDITCARCTCCVFLLSEFCCCCFFFFNFQWGLHKNLTSFTVGLVLWLRSNWNICIHYFYWAIECLNIFFTVVRCFYSTEAARQRQNITHKQNINRKLIGCKYSILFYISFLKSEVIAWLLIKKISRNPASNFKTKNFNVILKL